MPCFAFEAHALVERLGCCILVTHFKAQGFDSTLPANTFSELDCQTSKPFSAKCGTQIELIEQRELAMKLHGEAGSEKEISRCRAIAADQICASPSRNVQMLPQIRGGSVRHE